MLPPLARTGTLIPSPGSRTTKDPISSESNQPAGLL